MIRSISFRPFARDPQLEVTVVREAEQFDVARHGHRFLELVIVERGRAIHETEGGTHEVGKGDVFVLNPSRTHAYRRTHRFKVANILIRASFLERVEAELGSLPGYRGLFSLKPFPLQRKGFSSRLRLKESDLKKALAWVAEIERHAQGEGLPSRYLSEAWARVLIGFLVGEANRFFQSGERDGVASAVALIERSVLEPLRLDDIAKDSGLSKRTLLRRFREATGYSPIQYQLRCRINRGQSLLSDTDYGITEIAALCGFEDGNYFTRQFRRFIGMPPRQWRQRKRAGSVQAE